MVMRAGSVRPHEAETMAEITSKISPIIEVTTHGPYVVKGIVRLRNSRKESLPVGATVALCRCGHSGSKPFCDGMHARIGFSGTRRNTGPLDHETLYHGRQISIHDNRAICAHVGYCTDGLTAVFRLNKKPWIDPDGAEFDAVVSAIRECPSGALSYSVDGVHYSGKETDPMITVSKDGPYFITGGIGLTGDNIPQPPCAEHYTLCRCGASKRKPFCDGSHWDAGFKDTRN